MNDMMDIDVDKMLELLERNRVDLLALNKGLNQCIAEKAALEAENKQLREALLRFTKLDMTKPIHEDIAWDILNARAALNPDHLREDTEKKGGE